MIKVNLVGRWISGLDCFISIVYQTPKKEIISILFKLFKEKKMNKTHQLMKLPELWFQNQTRIIQVGISSQTHSWKKKRCKNVKQNFNKLNHIMFKIIIHHNHVRFILERWEKFNTRIFINIINHIKKRF